MTDKIIFAIIAIILAIASISVSGYQLWINPITQRRLAERGDEMDVKIVEVGKIFLGFRAGNRVSHPDLGIGIVVGFSSISSEPCVFFYSREKERPYCVGHEFLRLTNL